MLVASIWLDSRGHNRDYVVWKKFPLEFDYTLELHVLDENEQNYFWNSYFSPTEPKIFLSLLLPETNPNEDP